MKINSKILIKWILVLIVLSVLHTHANSQNLLWAKQFSGKGNQTGQTLAVGITGSIYSTGFFQDSTDFDPGPGSFYLYAGGLFDYKMYVSKLDASGNFLWAKALGGGSGTFEGYSMKTDASENVYITGIFAGTQDFDPGSNTYLMSASPFNAFILKLDAAGNFIWARKVNSGDFGQGNSVCIDNNFNVYTTGWFQGTSDFDPGSGIFNLTSNNNYKDIFISKIDSSGNLIWAKKIGGPDYDEGVSIVSDQNNNIFLTGTFRDSVDFDPGSGIYNLTAINSGTTDAFICKYDPSGNLLWAKQSDGVGSHSVIPSYMAKGSNNDVYLTGYFTGVSTVDFNPGIGNYFLSTITWPSEIFIWKLDSNGSFCWVKMLEGACNNWGTSIAVDNYERVHTSGIFCGTVDFDPDTATYLLSSFMQNIFISVLDSSGQFISAKHISSDSSQSSYNNRIGIDVDANGNNYMTGYFNGNTNFDSGGNNYYLNPVAGPDAFIIKNGNLTGLNEYTFENNQIFLYPNPNHGCFTLQCSSIISQLKIIDVFGKTLYQSEQFRSGSSLQINKVGIYFIVVKTNNGQITSKVIINKE